MSKFSKFIDIIPLSNIKNINIEKIKNIIINTKKENDKETYDYKKDNITLKIKDIIRETLLNTLDKEIPYNILTDLNINDNIKKHIDLLIINIKIKNIIIKK
ncbi:MAG TPA: hypothetical protein ACYCDB_01345 [Candidatus Azoamicus sp.]